MPKMTQPCCRSSWQFLRSLLAIGGASIFSGNCALAQIIPDNSLGNERSIVSPNVNIHGLPADEINGGAARGANLFHSFQEFNVGNGQRVYFANPAGIENILTRVTGSNISNILGTLGVDGGANLFLINPNGIIFGPNARLDIAGSFFASTADRVVFDNGFEFSATKPQAPPLLTISVRPGLQYGTNQSGAIANAGNLAVGQDLMLAAGNLDLQNQLHAGRNLALQALDTVKVRDSGANPFVASAGGQLVVQGNQRVDIFALNHPDSGFFSRGDMVLRSANTVGGDAHYWSGGNFRIEQLDSSLGNLSSPYDPIIRSLGDVSFNNYVGTSLHIFAAGKVNIGRVRITGSETGTAGIDYLAENITLSDERTVVPVNGSARPTLDVRAGVDPAVVGNPGLTGRGLLDEFNNIPFFGSPTITNTATSADINIGSITVEQPNGLVLLTNQYKQNPALNGNIQVTTIRVDDNTGSLIGSFKGDGGDVFFDSRGNITIPSSGLIKTDSATGKPGDITFIANGSFFMTNGALLRANTYGQEDAGNVNIKVGNTVSLTNSSILSTVESGAKANGGGINIQAGSLSLIDGAQLGTVVREASGGLPAGRGNAGNVSINVRDTVKIAGANMQGFVSGVYSRLEEKAEGNAGNIEIRGGSLLIDSATLDARTSGEGNAGNISVQVDGSVSLTNLSEITSNVALGAVGGGGNIEIKAGSLLLNDSAKLQADTFGKGNAGNISVQVDGSVSLSNTSIFTSSVYPTGIGNAGKIDVQARTISLTSGSTLLTSVAPAIGALPAGQRNGGDISILTTELNVSNGGQILTSAFGTGNAGNLSIKNVDSINVLNNGLISSSSFGTGAAGNLSIDTRSLSIRDKSKIFTSTAGSGAAGNLTVRAADSVEVVNGSQLSADTIGSGNGGNLTIETRSLSVRNGSGVSAVTRSSGQAGNIKVQASDSVSVDNQGIITTSSSGTGAAGNLSIETGNLSLQDASKIATNTTASGEAGNLTVKATNSVDVANNSKLSTDTDGSGNGGDLTIDTGSLSIRDSSEVSADTTSSGRGGNLRVQASDSVNVVNQSSLTTLSTETGGVAGNLSIATGRLSVRDASSILSSTLGPGDAGDLTVKAASSVEVANGSVLSSGTLGSGNGGDLTIETRELSLLNTGVVSTTTTSSGRGGNLRVQASDSVNLVNRGALITSSTDTGAAGNLFVETGKLSIRDTSGISTTTFGSSDAGDLTVKAADSVEVVNGSRLLTDTRSSGNAGNLTVETGRFSIRNGSEVLASTAPQSSGRGGTVNVKATDSVDISGSSGIFTLTAGTGRAGDMIVETGRLSAKDGGRVEAGTIGIAPGGNLTINASESIDLSGSSFGGVFRSGLSAFSLTAGNARSGNLTIATRQLNIRDGAEVTVTSLKGQAGNIDITADSVSMNQGRITAETRLGEGEGGANIALRLAENLLMSNESRLSATAFDAANGGNVNINARFIIAFPPRGPEGSDIIANAFLGNGGRVNVTAQSLFGIDFRKRLTPFNDITASSEFGSPGVVTISTLGVDPARGLAELPSEPGVPRPLEGCQPGGRRATSRFINAGRGGLSPGPTEPLSSNEVWRDVQLPTQLAENSTNAAKASTSPTTNPGQIVEAQGWTINEKGNVELVAEMPSVTAQEGCRLR